MHNLKILYILLWAFVVPVMAYDWGTNPGSGTVVDPYQISTVEQLTAIGTDAVLLVRHFVLTADINLGGTAYTMPLIAPDTDTIRPDFQGSPFLGTFDGRNYTISNFTLTAQSGRDIIGLFGKIEQASIRNLRLTNVSIQAPQANFVAAIAGQAITTSLFDNCNITGSVVGKNYVAGIAGYLSSVEVYNCSFDGTVTGTAGTSSIGGLIGVCNPGTIRRCFALGSLVTGTLSSKIGGLIGYINGTIVDSCAAEMDISCGDTSSELGGLIGTFDLFSTVRNCYSLGSIYAPGAADKAGGLIGHIAEPFIAVERSYSACSVNGPGATNIGGLIGNAGGLTPANCYFLSQADGGGPNNGIGTVLTSAQMKQKSSFAGFDFVGQTSDGVSDYWRLCIGGTVYPRLSWESSLHGDLACPKGVTTDDLLALAGYWLAVSGEGNQFSEACDANGDNKVDLADQAVLSVNWLSKNTDFDLGDVWNLAAHWLSTSATWDDGDYTGDGKVDLQDWNFLAQNYNAF